MPRIRNRRCYTLAHTSRDSRDATHARRAVAFRHALVFAAMAMATAMTGCAAGDEELDPTSSDALRNGTATFEHPEVGEIVVSGGYCTATLIRPNVAITAAHCVSYGTSDQAGQNLGRFSLYRSATQRSDYTITRYRSFASSVGANDIALLLLGESVPASVATPASPAQALPSSGTTVTIYGFGCTDRDTHAGSWTKRRYSYAWGGSTSELCPGDSGGPTLNGNQIVRINSGYYLDTAGTDIFGNVAANFRAINDQVVAWTGSGFVPSPAPAPTPNPAPPPSPTPTPTDACNTSTDCASCTARSACGWCAGRCRTGTTAGSNDGVCRGSTWAWLSSQCVGSSTPTPPPAPADPCATSTDCGSCTARSTCGWCAGRCRTGTSTGSNDGVCIGSTWAWVSSQCR